MISLRWPQFSVNPAHIGGKLEGVDLVAFDATQDPWSFAVERRFEHHYRAAMLAPLGGIILAHSAILAQPGLSHHSNYRDQFRKVILSTVSKRLPWSAAFDEPIPLPKGRKLVTLQDAGAYITRLPKAEHDAPEWQAAMEALILVAEHDGPTGKLARDL